MSFHSLNVCRRLFRHQPRRRVNATAQAAQLLNGNKNWMQTNDVRLMLRRNPTGDPPEEHSEVLLVTREDEASLRALVPAGAPAGMPAGAGLPARMIGGRAHVARMTKKGTLTFRKRPAMQATNTRALKRSLRRIEGFQTVVKRVYKAMPALKPLHGSVRSYRGGHKAGCRCVACKAGR